MSSGGEKTTTVSIPGPTPEERAIQQRQLQISEEQLKAIQSQQAFQQDLYKQLQPELQRIEELAPQRLAVEKQQLESAQKLGPIYDELVQIQLDNIKRGNAATPEQKDLIKQVADSQIAQGTTDIERFQTENLGKLRDELAGSLGLRPTDTPILDRGAKIAAEAQRQQGQLVQGARGAQAQAELNYPLAEAQLQTQQIQFQQNLAQSAQDFQAQLRDAAFQNRLALSGQTGQLGLGLATGVNAQLPSIFSSLTQARIAQGQTTTNVVNNPGVLGYIQAAGSLAKGVGGLFTGGAAAGIF